jgi:hypothetical protein
MVTLASLMESGRLDARLRPARSGSVTHDRRRRVKLTCGRAGSTIRRNTVRAALASDRPPRTHADRLGRLWTLSSRVSVSCWRRSRRCRPGLDPLGNIGVVCAFGVHPLRVVLRGVVDRLLVGDRPDPLRAATRVADSVSDNPGMAMDAVHEALVLPYAAPRSGAKTLASAGTPVTHTHSLPLRLGADGVGAGGRAARGRPAA